MLGKTGRRKDLKSSIPWLIGSGILALVSIGGGFFYIFWLNRSPKPIPVRVVTVKHGTVETTINASGTVQLGDQQTLKSPAEGAVDQVLVEPGDRVQAGQLLLTLRNPERQTALTEQRIKIRSQEILLNRNRQRVVEAQQQLALDQERLQTLKSLVQEGAIPRNDYQEQDRQTRQTLADLRTAETDTHTAVLELQNLQLESQRIQQALANTVIRAPHSGIVLGVVVQNGDGVQLRTDLLTLGDPSQELVQLQLSTLDATQVHINQLARISVIGPNPKIYLGRVQSLYPQAIVSSAEGQRSPGGDDAGQATVPTTVHLDTPSHTLIPGSQVNVEIVLEQRRNVIALSIEAIQRSPTPFVWVLNQGRVKQQPIKIGLEGLTMVEVASGLKPGEQIVLPPANVSLSAGMPVISDSPAENQ